MQLARFPRRRYTPHFTPIERLRNLSDSLGGAEIWIKRDDLTGLAAGGNNTRKLEFLVADALAQGCDTLILCISVKAMAGLIGMVRRGERKRGERVLFVHTGGSPALYAYQAELRS